ncbi:unnamed protein product [Toxocara canis]|uniref:C-type lectin domain-containing protein n=1 Tax=Toxocara canis TaxID=6265 RepID=A0A183U2G9_TOXCA|nr:unnamed protein product [Toxocara canis]
MLCFVSNCSAYLFDLADNTIIGIGAKTAEEWRFQTLGSVLGAISTRIVLRKKHGTWLTSTGTVTSVATIPFDTLHLSGMMLQRPWPSLR